MNLKQGVILFCGLALAGAAATWIVMQMDLSVEVRLVSTEALGPNDPAVRSVEAINGTADWLIPAGLVVIFAVGGFFYFRELLKQRAYDRRKPPN